MMMIGIRLDRRGNVEVTIDGLPSGSDAAEMRTARVFAVVAPSLLFAAASFLACDDSSGGGSSSGFESEGGPAFEAGPQADGAQPDSFTPDGANADGAMGTGVTVMVGDTVKPEANVRVIFQDAAGAILGEAKTDAAGMAVSTALPSMVTVLYAPPAQGSSTVTFMGVTDGDSLHVAPTPATDPSPRGDIKVTFAANAITANAKLVDVYTGHDLCSNSSGSLTGGSALHMTGVCAHTPNTIFASVDNQSTTKGFAIAKMVATPAANATVDVGPLTFTAAGTRTQVATNLPAASGADSRVWSISGTDMHFLHGTNDNLITDAAGIDTAVPLDGVDAFQSAVFTQYETGGGGASSEVIQRIAATAAATAAFAPVDFATALPTIQGVNAGAAPRPDVTITTSAAPTAASGAYVMIRWGAENASSWTFVMPGNTTTFKVPALPADATTFTPVGAVTVSNAGYVGGALVPSYGALKALPIPTDALPSVLDEQQPLPANGLVKISTFELFTD